jgi:copper oxidase (laccase) domain-containing protein
VKTGQLRAEQFAALNSLRGITHGFTLRVPGLEMTLEKEEALRRLDGVHREILEGHGLSNGPLITAQQVHGAAVAVVENVRTSECLEGCDALVTDESGVTVGIYVADCCAAFIIDPTHEAIGLAHSGKRGTELRIVPNAIRTMQARYGSRPEDLVVQLSPCIRPPHYEIDFAGAIVQQCREVGVTAINDCGVCTACDLERYYSYRAEKGRTGRMLAFLALTGAVES